ncbi:Transcriptional regulator, AraC family protein [Minicystis rosea]|nr:Transcriptional regulator, AraC family protein [Minicystis rosea]
MRFAPFTSRDRFASAPDLRYLCRRRASSKGCLRRMSWEGRLHVAASYAVFFGRGVATPVHAHLPAKWIVGTSSVSVADASGTWRETAFVPHARAHEVDPRGHEVLLVYLEPGRSIRSDDLDALRDAFARKCFASAVRVAEDAASSTLPDALARANEVLRANGTLHEAARRAGLSPSRLSHVFSSVVGAPPARARVWHRLRRALVAVGEGASVTEAAHEAGFSDASHFSRVCRASIGIAPSTLRESELSLDPSLVAS